MSKTKLIVAAVLFLAVTCLKLVLPSAAGQLREELQALMNTDTDLRASMTRLGAQLSGEEGLIYALGLQTPTSASPRSESTSAPEPKSAYRPVTLPMHRAVFTAGLGKAPELPEAEAAVPDAEPEAGAGEPSQEEAAVAAFLAAQSSYADYAVPANVSYAMPALDLEYVCPVSGMTSSGFGYRVHPLSGEVKFHYGTDFAAWTGADILCFADGVVSHAGEDSSFGKHIIVDHDQHCRTLYAHCSALLAAAGERVTAGQVIAQVGDTGQVTGPHLHFELMQNDLYLNPEYYVNYMG